MNDLSGLHVVLGVTGGIAAFKAATVASLLVQAGARVDVILTEGAQRFIRPLTFSAITHSPVHTDHMALWGEDFSGHVTLAGSADLVIVAPATASSLARFALGLSDDLIALVVLSTAAPVLVAPAMEERMFHHPVTQLHLETLVSRGVTVVGPTTGRLASGAIGAGRMVDPEAIVAAATALLRSRTSPLAGKKLIVTAGGTRESIDPVRYVGNRSSGRMGHAIAASAARAGARVQLISTVPMEHAPPGVDIRRVETAEQMLRAVTDAVVDADVLIMAAAVADFRPERANEHKIKKETGKNHLDLHLVRTPDILAAVDRPGLLKIGFAAETEHLIENARRKLTEKGLAMIVANDATATIGATDITATIIHQDGTADSLPRMSKELLADEIVYRVSSQLGETARTES